MGFVDKIDDILAQRKGSGLERQTKKFGRKTAKRLAKFSGPGLKAGLNTLMEILGNQGQISPAMRNIQLSDISRGTQVAQDQALGNLAAANLQNSGVGQAILASIGQAGADRRAQTLAQFDREAEDRMRQDLGLLFQLLLGPGFQAGQSQLDRELAELLARISKPEGPKTDILGGLGSLAQGAAGFF